MSISLTGEKYSMMHKDINLNVQKPRWLHMDGMIKDCIFLYLHLNQALSI